MQSITLSTDIYAPATRCFYLSLSIDLHKKSTSSTNEEAIEGITSGIIGLNETVTWRARHLGRYRTLTTKITAFDQPHHFTDEMIKGDFRWMKHQHFFEENNGCTTMTDIFEFEAPYGLAGELFSALFLKCYMKSFLLKRNALIKSIAESDDWKQYIATDAGSEN